MQSFPLEEEIDSIKGKMDQPLEMMMAQNKREEERCNIVHIRNAIPVRGLTTLPWMLVPNHLIYGLHPDFTPQTEETPGQPHLVHIFAATIGHNIQGLPITKASNIPPLQGDEEPLDEYDIQYYHEIVLMFNHATAQESEAMKMCR